VDAVARTATGWFKYLSPGKAGGFRMGAAQSGWTGPQERSRSDCLRQSNKDVTLSVNIRHPILRHAISIRCGSEQLDTDSLMVGATLSPVDERRTAVKVKLLLEPGGFPRG
jgi:hypothetical protein